MVDSTQSYQALSVSFNTDVVCNKGSSPPRSMLVRIWSHSTCEVVTELELIGLLEIHTVDGTPPFSGGVV